MSSVSRRIALVLAAAAAAAACVPASEPAPPAGALGFAVEPSAGSRGEPFVTSDGWTVRVEKIAIQVSVSAMPIDDGKSRQFYGSSEIYRFDASKSAVVFARAIPTGLATGSISLETSYIEPGNAARYDKDTEVVGLSAEDSARFLTPADATTNTGSYASYSGPSILIALRAEKAGRVIALDLTLDGQSGYGEEGPSQHQVQADSLTTVPLGIAVEALFTDENAPQVLHFGDFATADADGDGVVTGQELSTAVGCQSCVRTTDRFLDTVRSRSGRIFVAR